MDQYQQGIKDLCVVEQDIVMGVDSSGESIADPMQRIMPTLFGRNIRYNYYTYFHSMSINFEGTNFHEICGHNYIFAYCGNTVLCSVNNKLRILSLYISLKGGGCVCMVSNVTCVSAIESRCGSGGLRSSNATC